ncbi:MAG TPA: nuclear transport factor 2 family protein [Solirubrobacteraceae bacterium]|nr:nuclear transport factor 2 family protein [Solirubrobacteraceae bacterium]
MTIGDEQRLRNLYASFNARDADAVLAATAADVDWPNAWEGGRVIGHAAVRDYWTRQWQQIDPRVEPESIVTRRDGRIAVDVHQVVRDLSGAVIADGHVVHVYELRDGLVVRMTVEESG